jgi:tRNA pseudouridine55 synthase
MSGAGDAPFGVLLVDKPEGPTSHDVVGWIRWGLDVAQVGHCGTLDPAASGLLVICVGPATRLVPYLTGVDKAYRARFALGRSTTTEDREGETVATAPVDAAAHAAARAALAGLHGEHSLPPPAFSAVKVDGQRAHRLARRGEAPELAPRPMAVRSVDDLAAGGSPGPWVEATMTVSKGTYIRALAVELGRRVGVPAHLAALRRLACGSLRVDDAVTGLHAETSPPARPGAPPRTRLSLPGAADRDELRRRLTAALREPTTVLPLPLVTVPADDPHGLLARTTCGQWVPLGPELHAVLPLPAVVAGEGLPPGERWVLRGPDHLVIARRDDARLVPERVLALARETFSARNA